AGRANGEVHPPPARSTLGREGATVESHEFGMSGRAAAGAMQKAHARPKVEQGTAQAACKPSYRVLCLCEPSMRRKSSFFRPHCAHFVHVWTPRDQRTIDDIDDFFW